MKRLMVLCGLLAFASPALASEPERSSLDEQPADEQPAQMTDAEFDDVVAGNNGYAWGHYKNGKALLPLLVSGSNVAINVALIFAPGNSTINLTQIALAGSVVLVPGGTAPTGT